MTYFSRTPVSFERDGETYSFDSLKQCGDFFGVQYRQVSRALDNGSFETLGRGKGANRISTWANGVEYPSQDAAARAHNISPGCLSSRFSRAKKRGEDWAIVKGVHFSLRNLQNG